MLRAIWLTVQNEARLLIKDPIVLFMLLFAPVVIITVAGYSLGSLYGGGAPAFRLPVADHDHGRVSEGIVDALSHERSVTVELVDDTEGARRLVSQRDRTPLAIEIPAGTGAAVTQGRAPRLILFIDPVRRIEVNALELRIAELCRRVTAQARAAAQKQLAQSAADLRQKISRLTSAVAQEQSQVHAQFGQIQTAIEASVRAQTAAALKHAGDQAAAINELGEGRAWSEVRRQLSERAAILRKIQDYLVQLQTSQGVFEDWLVKLRKLAGSHASEIPPPPAFPAPLSATDLAQLSEPITPPKFDQSPTMISAPDSFSIKIPKLLAWPDNRMLDDLRNFESAPAPTLPGNLGFVERPAIDGEAAVVNAFDQYVPGFGITFLLIGMMLGIALTLFDEREWGTLKRLQVSGTPLSGLLIGKIIARFIVGVVQMILLFAVGWALFGITLGREPLALLIPTVGISFAAAALGLLIASISRAHDSVMPLGVTASMAMAAIGGCWWPLDFEPGWMRALARWMPTTWTMQAFNDLMIRNQPPSVALTPLLATVGLGILFLLAGIVRFVTLED